MHVYDVILYQPGILHKIFPIKNGTVPESIEEPSPLYAVLLLRYFPQQEQPHVHVPSHGHLAQVHAFWEPQHPPANAYTGAKAINAIRDANIIFFIYPPFYTFLN